MKVSLASLALVFALSLAAHSCKENLATKIDDEFKPCLMLSVADSSSKELWLRLKSENISLPYRVQIWRDSLLIHTKDVYAEEDFIQESLYLSFYLENPDLYAELKPNTPYTYRAYRIENNRIVDSSNLVQTRTMDTTSHDWTWTMETFGDFSGSGFYDVAIVNDTLAYAVGEIYLNDSLGQHDPTLYNLAIWNGQRWRFERRNFTWRLLYPNSGGEPQGTSSIRSIFAFNPNDIWIAAQTVQHWNGTTWTEYAAIVGYDNQGFPIAAGGALKIWGNSSSNLYFVGRGGLIIHYNGSSWRKIESGTTVDLTDIYGTPDGKEVWVCAFTSDDSTALLRIRNGVCQTVWATWQTPAQNLLMPNFRGVVGVCCFGNLEVRFGSGSVQYYVPFPPHRTYYLENIDFYPDYPLWANYIRGSSKNNMFTSNYVGEIHHWNGVRFKKYNILTENDRVRNITVSKNEMFAVGFSFSGYAQKALVLKGRR